MWPMLSGRNLTSPRTEILFTPLKGLRPTGGNDPYNHKIASDMRDPMIIIGARTPADQNFRDLRIMGSRISTARSASSWGVQMPQAVPDLLHDGSSVCANAIQIGIKKQGSGSFYLGRSTSAGGRAQGASALHSSFHADLPAPRAAADTFMRGMIVSALQLISQD